MAAPTNISVSVDRVEYSKFEAGKNIVTIQFQATGTGMLGEQLRVQLVKARRTRDKFVYDVVTNISSTSNPFTGSISVDLISLVDGGYLNLVRHGKYFVKVSSVTNPNIFGISSDFFVSLISVELMKSHYLFGLTLSAYNMRQVRVQPKNVTGVEVVYMSSTHPIVLNKLAHLYSPGTPIVHQLSWAAGPVISITGPGEYILKYDCNGLDYMVVRVTDLAALPTTSTADELLVEQQKMSDDSLRRYIDQACDWWESLEISVYLEPTKLVTDLDLQTTIDDDWDFIKSPITFYPLRPAKWIEVLFPFPSLLRIDRMFGEIANTRIVDIDTTWVEISEKSGMVQLVPYHASQAFRFIGLQWVESLRGPVDLPNFWHYNCTAGLRVLDPVVLEIIGKKAAIDALIAAGQAFRSGISSQSISRDGVSESVSYLSGAMYGPFSGTVTAYREFIETELTRFRGAYRGVNMVVL